MYNDMYVTGMFCNLEYILPVECEFSTVTPALVSVIGQKNWLNIVLLFLLLYHKLGSFYI